MEVSDNEVWRAVCQDWDETQRKLEAERAMTPEERLAEDWIQQVRDMNPKPYRASMKKGRIGFTTPITDPTEVQEWERRRAKAAEGIVHLGRM